MLRTTRRITVNFMIVAALLGASEVSADTSYSITDGTAEQVISIDPGEAMVWMNTFPVDPAGGWVDSISVAYGRPGSFSTLNGQPVTILLYEDLNGGSPQDARLKWSFGTTIANANLNVYNTYSLPAMLVQGNLAVAALYQNGTAVAKFIAPLDTSVPSFANRSYVGFAATIDPQNLTSVPPGQWGTIESFGSNGNFRIDAHGLTTVDDTAVALHVEPGQPPLVHLTWTGSQPSYQVERATRADFRDGRVIATGIQGTTYDDATAGSASLWFYRVR